MKLYIILILLLSITILDVESRKLKSSSKKNKYVVMSRGGRGVFSHSRPTYFARPIIYNRPWYSSYWRPYFRWNWLRGIPSYSNIYIKRNRISCNQVCNIKLSGCGNTMSKIGANGQLRCYCSDTGNNSLVIDYCWTPNGCIKATSFGCNAIYNRLNSRITDEINKRRR